MSTRNDTMAERFCTYVRHVAFVLCIAIGSMLYSQKAWWLRCQKAWGVRASKLRENMSDYEAVFLKGSR